MADSPQSLFNSGSAPNEKPFRAESLEIQNYKGLDALKLEFPMPSLGTEPDITTLGSKNGVGKTSVLESFSLLLLVAALEEEAEAQVHLRKYSDVAKSVVRTGQDEALIKGKFTYGEEEIPTQLRIDEDGDFHTGGDTERLNSLIAPHWQKNRRTFGRGTPVTPMDEYFSILYGHDPDPLILNRLIYFHSFRRIREGDPEMGTMVQRPEEVRFRKRPDEVPSRFKIEVLRILMSKAGLFEEFEKGPAEQELEFLNGLMERFVGGEIEKLKPSEDNTLEFRLTTGEGKSISFDMLSSGQKEIVASLFLIWHYTRETPGIVLIDEPELHLNQEWHKEYIRFLEELNPNNQYVIATHSEDVFSAVPEQSRMFLTQSG